MSRSPLVLALALFTLVPLRSARADTSSAFEDVRDVSELEPLRIEDAIPEDGFSGQISTMTGADSGETGILSIAQVTTGFPWLLEIGAEYELGYLDGKREVGPAEFHAFQQIAMEEVIGVALAVRASLLTPHEEAGYASKLVLLATRTSGHFRVHGEARYQVQARTEDNIRVGIATDYIVRTTWLLLADAYYEELRDDGKRVFVAEAGTTFEAWHWLKLYGALGIGRYGRDVHPHVLFGMTFSG